MIKKYKENHLKPAQKFHQQWSILNWLLESVTNLTMGSLGFQTSLWFFNHSIVGIGMPVVLHVKVTGLLIVSTTPSYSGLSIQDRQIETYIQTDRQTDTYKLAPRINRKSHNGGTGTLDFTVHHNHWGLLLKAGHIRDPPTDILIHLELLTSQALRTFSGEVVTRLTTFPKALSNSWKYG